MADEPKITSPNAITESVLAVNQLVLGSAASSAMASMYVSMSHAAGIGAQNSVSAQHHLNILGAAALAAGTGNLLWEGLNRTVDNLTIDDRLKYWQQMMAISTGGNPQDAKSSNADDQKENTTDDATGKKEASNGKSAATDPAANNN